MNGNTAGLVAREAVMSMAVLKARQAGSDPYAPVFMGSGRRGGLVDPVERECPAWMLFADEAAAR
ncbi:MAG: hypothetical protein RLO51_16170 [Thalassobaculum sp.]|uniref:hypothetical protein n=1 Tax=Thalassobaculum sp. TaxID=2022740 RepID=UPI0032EF59DD